ncbi:uncharacterized protein LOC131893338 [Tigriopus californicus]|uniref:uncharacterized protein LOC131893338 n=1 Tax=Tigriopus californicus TaxID=6832 RepID=UPI0027DA193C|nr:uncharacterized protein LOC131893338 [Tigriopus californicus]
MEVSNKELLAMIRSQERLEKLLGEKDEPVTEAKREIRQFQALLIQLEKSTQNLTPQSKEEAYILTKWCETHIDPKVQFVRLAEGLIENMEIEASDSVSNVLRLAFEADRDHDSIPSISRDNIIRDNLSQPSDVSQQSKMSKPSDGYKEAKRLLQREFGNNFRITSAYKSQLDNWPSVQEDPEEMKRFSIILQQCQTAMNDLGTLATLSDPDALDKLMAKLPNSCQSMWRRKVMSIENNDEREATFSNFVYMVQQVSDEWNHPVFGLKRRGFETSRKNLSLATLNDLRSENLSVDLCLFCSAGHDMSDCEAAMSLNLEERKEKLQGRCFGCLHTGHWARTCRQRSRCRKCKRRHPTILHWDEAQGNERVVPLSSLAGAPPSPGGPEDISVDVRSVHAIKEKKDGPSIAVALVPVRIRQVGSSKEIVTYAAQDPYSTDTFVKEDVVKALGLTGRPVQIALTTMERRDSPWSSSVIEGLQVLDMEETHVIDLPPSFSHRELPVTKEDIPTKRQAEAWPHLENIPFNYSDSDVGILIGMNAPRALRPLRLVLRNDDEPYAVQTKLGWTVHGPISGGRSNKKVNPIKVRTEADQDMVLRLFEADFPDAIGGHKRGRSIEDKLWESKVESSICVKDGHYQIALPFRNDKPQMPNNKMQVLRRANHLAKKFEGDAQFKRKYVESVEKMIHKKYAEKIPTNENPELGHSYFIPHHGVTHPRKHGEIREGRV